jgi:hypothetical protein
MLPRTSRRADNDEIRLSIEEVAEPFTNAGFIVVDRDTQPRQRLTRSTEIHFEIPSCLASLRRSDGLEPRSTMRFTSPADQRKRSGFRSCRDLPSRM